MLNFNVVEAFTIGVPIVAQQVKNPTGIHEDAGLIPGLTHWVKGCSFAMNCVVGHRHGLDMEWLWCRPVASALIGYP